VLFPKDAEEVAIFIKTDKPLIANSLLLHPAEVRINAECQIYIKERWRISPYKTFLIDRSNPNLNVGPVPYAPICVSLGGIRSDDLKLVFKLRKGYSLIGSILGGIKDLEITEALKLERYPEKLLLKMEQKDPVFKAMNTCGIDKMMLWERTLKLTRL